MSSTEHYANRYGSIESHTTETVWAGLTLFAGVCVLFALNQPTVHTILDLWKTPAYGHGPLAFSAAILTATLTLVKNRHRLNPEPMGLLILAALGVVMFLAEAIDLLAARQLALVIAAYVIAGTLLGRHALTDLLVPVFILSLTISVWDLLLPAFRSITALASTAMVSLSGVPVHRDAFFIFIPEGQFEIATACAGLSYFLAGMTTSLLIGFFEFKRLSHRLILASFAAVWFVFVNALRVTILIWIGHQLGVDHSWVADHGTQGWWVFAASLLPFFGIVHYASRHLARPIT